MSDCVDFEDPGFSEEEEADAVRSVSRIASLNAKAVMPDGRTLSRGEILATLGLNPSTSPTAWLTVIACGSNASALLPVDLQRVASRRLSAVSGVISRFGGGARAGGFAVGGTMRDAPEEE